MAESTSKPHSNESLASVYLTPGRMATLACLMEVTAPKPGNVHRGADFEDVRFLDFAVSAVVIGGIFDDQIDRPLGELILSAVEGTRAAVGTNTNLGLILLLAPLVKASQLAFNRWLSANDVKVIFDQRTPDDGSHVFRAIAAAKPGGMGQVDEMDVHAHDGELDLLEAMRLAQNRDSIAAQYASSFSDVFQTGQALLRIGKQLFSDIDQAIVFAHVSWIAINGDSLIARKCGPVINQQAQDHASTALGSLGIDVESWKQIFRESASWDSIQPSEFNPDPDSIDQFWTQVGSLDFWLRSDGHRRNPGTTADLIGASLFVAMHNRLIQLPVNSKS